MSCIDYERCEDEGIVVLLDRILAVSSSATRHEVRGHVIEQAKMLFAPLGKSLESSLRYPQTLTNMLWPGYIQIKLSDSQEWAPTGLVLVVEVRSCGAAESLHLVCPRQQRRHNFAERFHLRPALDTEQEKELQKFRQDLPFTFAKVEDNLALLEGDIPTSVTDRKNIVVTTITNSRVEIVHTGAYQKKEPSGLGVFALPVICDDSEDECGCRWYGCEED